MSYNIPADIPQKEKTYDDLFKEILETFPTHLVIAFLNSTFKHSMPADSIIEPLRTEFNAKSRVTADYFLKVTEPDGTVRYFHLEAQTTNDNRMVFRMIEYGMRFALQQANDAETDDILIELPHAVVFYLRDTRNTPRKLNVVIKTPDGQEIRYAIPTELMSDYTPEDLLEQDKFPLFPFYMLNYEGKNPEELERAWLAGCAKLAAFVENGRMEKSDAKTLLENSRIVIEKTKLPNKEEVLNKMTMFDTVGVGVDWIELKRRQDKAVAEAVAEVVAEAKAEAAAEAKAEAKNAEYKTKIATAKKLLAKGVAIEIVAESVEISIDEVKTLAKEI